MSRIGDRVGAIQSAGETEVQFYGYGVYMGEFIPPMGINWMGDALHEAKVTNPLIKLDGGGYTWGFCCWWGPEDHIKKMIGLRDRVMVSPEPGPMERGAQ